jgi:hypothetical protein
MSLCDGQRQGERINKSRPMKQAKQRSVSVKDILKADEPVDQSDVGRPITGKDIDGFLKHHHPAASR